MSETETIEITEGIVDWVVEVIPEIQLAYDHATDERIALPDVAVEMDRWEVGMLPIDQKLAKISQLQQKKLKVWYIEVIVVVPPDPADEAEDLLKTFADRLEDSIRDKTNLGNRVDWVGENPTALFRPPFVEFDDGTRGRIVTLSMQIGKQLEV